MAVTLVNTANVTDNGTLELLNGTLTNFGEFNAVTAAAVGGATYLFGTGFTDDGVSVFSLAADGTLTNVAVAGGNVTDTEGVGELFLNGAVTVATAVVSGTTFLFVGGAVDDGISVFSVSATDGHLTNVFNLADTEVAGELFLDGVASLTAALIGGVTYLYAVGADDDGISVFSVSAAGVLTPVQNVGTLSEPRGLHIATVAGTPFLFIADVGDDTVLSNVINPGIGTITNAAAVVDNATLQLDGAVSVTSALVGAKTFAFVAGSSESVTLGGISVFEVAANGSLTNVFNQPDNASLFLGSVDALATATIAGTAYLFAVNTGELAVTGGALSVFGVAADGTLIPFAAVSDEGIGGADPLKLARACTVTTAVVGGDTFVIVGSQSDSGLSVFRVDTTGLTINGTAGNDTINALSSAAGQFLPSDLGDQIFGFAGSDTIAGLAGGDTLTGGSGKDLLIGGADADIFDFNVKAESKKGTLRDVINDFSGIDGGDLDRIDVSGIDARTTRGGNQNFKFIGAQHFHHKAGELHFVKKAGFVVVEGDTNGDGHADFQIELSGLVKLTAGDFVL